MIVWNHRPVLRWIPGTIIERKGPVSYLILVLGGELWKRHIHHLRERPDSPQDFPVEPRYEAEIDSDVDGIQEKHISETPASSHNSNLLNFVYLHKSDN